MEKGNLFDVLDAKCVRNENQLNPGTVAALITKDSCVNWFTNDDSILTRYEYQRRIPRILTTTPLPQKLRRKTTTAAQNVPNVITAMSAVTVPTLDMKTDVNVESITVNPYENSTTTMDS